MFNVQKIVVALVGLALLLSNANLVNAQSGKAPILQFEKLSHYFGTIIEEKGTVSTEFQFTNKGNAPLVIVRVHTDCGCTVPQFNKEAIAPNSSGAIRISFDPMGRPGPFIKKIRVYANDKESPTILEIKGNVSSVGEKNLNELQYKIGELEIQNETLSMGIITPKKHGIVRTVVRNNYSYPIEVHILSHPSYITVSSKKFSLSAGEPSDLYFESRLSKNEKAGFYNSPIEFGIYKDGKLVQKGKMHIFASLLPQLVPPSERPSSIQAKIDTWIDLGIAPRGSIKKGRIEIQNKSSQKKLEVYDVFCRNEAIRTTIKNKIIAPNKVGIIEYSIDTSKVSQQGGNFEENLELLLSDPFSPIRKVKILIKTEE